MELPSIIASILIAALAIYLVVNPFFQKKTETKMINEENTEKDIKHLYVTLNEIEMDYHMGKLTEKDYQELRTQYETLTASQLHQRQHQEEQQEQEFQQLVEKKNQLSREINELKVLANRKSEETIQKLQALEEELATVLQSLQKFIS